MKKIILKKNTDYGPKSRIGYKINYEYDLNAAQYEAVMHNNGPALIIAGAGTGKTRTLIYRVARLIEDGVKPEEILLLTFTRKSSAEMLRRASGILDGRCEKVSGGTFHSFALQTLRKYANAIGFDPGFNILDQSDSEDTINLLRSRLKLDKRKKRFPSKSVLNNMFSLAVNKRMDLQEILEKYYPRFLEDIAPIEELSRLFSEYKRSYNLFDYDDLLLYLLKLLSENKGIHRNINSYLKFVMVDEYQDTNRLQHEIVLKLGGKNNNIVAVGDDAQSIYSFRGADFQNIMFFPESFEDCKIYRIEENYRSIQPILSLTNEIIRNAAFKYEKELFTRILGDNTPKLISAANEKQQSEFISERVLEITEEGLGLDDIAVLFRSSFHSFDLEIELNKSNIPYKKFGGLKLIETAHIKDILSFLKVTFNTRDAVSWQRSLVLMDGIGNKTASELIEILVNSDIFAETFTLNDIKRGKDSINELMKTLKEVKSIRGNVGEKIDILIEFYKPLLKNKYSDWKKRVTDLEMFKAISERYRSLQEFLSDMALDPPTESVSELLPEDKEDTYLTLSTIHSAKGLEWKAVFIIWALEGRFPSAKSAESIDEIEEERRLFYVACTRAKNDLYIVHPINIFERSTGSILSEPSRFVKGIDEEILEKYVLVDEELDNKIIDDLNLN